MKNIIKKIISIVSLVSIICISSAVTCFADETYFIPEGLGNMHTYTHWNSQNWKYDNKKLIDALRNENKISDSYGIVTYGNTFAGATTTSFGNVGDVLLVVQTDGIIYPVTIADVKSQVYCAWDHNPANMWGHHNGKDIVEFEVLSYCAKSLYNGTGWYISPEINKNIYKIINIGSYFEDNTLVNHDVIVNKIREHGMVGYMLLVNPYGGIIV